MCNCGSQGIEKEYNELDTVWFMAGSLFNKYPYDIPTEAFSLGLFVQVCCKTLSDAARHDLVQLRLPSAYSMSTLRSEFAEQRLPEAACSYSAAESL